MIFVTLLILGLCVGSFINALVWRLHAQESKSKKKTAKNFNLSILNGRSVCPNCKHQLAAKDLIPVLSWLSLRGKCRYCKQPISIQYPLVELLTAFLFVFSYLYWPLYFDSLGKLLLAFWLMFLVGLIALAVYDLKWLILPDKIIRPLIALGILQAIVLVLTATTPTKQFISIAFSFLIGGGLFYVLFQISGGKWIGGGDVKLGGLLGLILASPSLIIFTIFAASLLGTLMALPLMITGKLKRTSKIPFGPLLIAGAIIAQLFGLSLINWYKHKFLYY